MLASNHNIMISKGRKPGADEDFSERGGGGGVGGEGEGACCCNIFAEFSVFVYFKSI